jgi:hypothetical protein
LRWSDLCFLTLVILNLPDKATARLKLGLGSLLCTALWPGQLRPATGSRTGDAGFAPAEIVRQKEALQQQNQELRLQLMQDEGMRRENDRLRHLLGWQPQKILEA